MEVKRRFLPLLLGLSVGLGLLGAGQDPSVKPLLPTAPRDLHPPFEAGEEVLYDVNWKPVRFLFPAIKAGEVRLKVEQSTYQNQRAFKISGWVTSAGLLKTLANLDVRDYYESIMDARDLRSHRFLHQRRQNQKERDIEVVFDYSENYTLITETDVSRSPPRQIRSEKRHGIPGPVVDTVSVFYAARWQHLEPGQHFRLYLSDHGRIREIGVRIEGAEKLRLDIGRFETLRIRAHGDIFSGGGEFRIWYTRDERRLPVKFEAEVSVGKVYGHLTRLQTPRLTKERVRIP